MRMRKKPNLIPRIERCASILVSEPETYKDRWRELYPECSEMLLEIGCGKGKFTTQTAAQMPDKLIIAMERVPEALIVAMEMSMSMDIPNLFFINADAAMLQDYFSEGEVDMLYINFCDPWPSKRHEKRRLTSPAFLDSYKAILKKDAQIHFKTDNRQLFEYSLKQFELCGFSVGTATFDLHANGAVGIMTGYEEKFYSQGTPICHCEAIIK